MRSLLLLLVAALCGLATPVWALSCRPERPVPLSNYVQQLDKEYPVIIEAKPIAFKETEHGGELTLNILHAWKGPLAGGSTVSIRVPAIPTVGRPSAQDLGVGWATWLLFLNAEKEGGGFSWFTACGAALRYGGSAGTAAALYHALLIELDTHFKTTNVQQDKLNRSLRW